jgi:GTP cyclohydrolase I
VVEATHGCMRCRGVRKEGARMVTAAYEGAFATPDARREFLHLVKG